MKAIILCLFSYLCFLFFELKAAMPMTHVYLAELWLEYNNPSYDNLQKREFILGNLFPDIRYLGNISRNDTHEKGVTLNRIRNAESPFLAGKRLHSYIDEKREILVESLKIYPKLEEVIGNKKQLFTLLKLLEDSLLYDFIQRYEVVKYLTHTSNEELVLADGNDVLKWHLFLSFYFTFSPKTTLNYAVASGKSFFGLTHDNLKVWYDNFEALKRSEFIQGYFRKMVKQFTLDFKQV